MQYDTFFAGAYRIEKTLEHSAYSVLGMGKKLDTGEPVLLRLWLTAHATAEKQERIQAEVEALQQVQHPHLLPILEVRASAQGVFLVNPYAASGSLNDYLQQQFLKPLLLEDALGIIQQIGQALQALHQQDIIHGNLTPHAVFFSEPGHVLLGDFRIQSILKSIQNYQPALEEGIPQCWYMAPERFQGVCHAESDQYALGCLAYLLLTGHVPFAGSARVTLLQKHQRDQPKALAEINPAIPVHMEAALFKALAKQPSERYSSIQEFLEALEASYRTAIANQDTLAQSFDAAFAGQEALKQSTPDTLVEVPTSAMPKWGADSPSSEPVAAATWTRSRVSGVSPVVLARPADRKQLAGRSSRTRGPAVLLSMILLVLVIVLAVGRWIFVSGGQIQPQQGTGQTVQTAPSASVQATANSAQSPLPAAASTPTIVSSSAATPSPPPTSGGVAKVTPFLDCVTSTGGNLIAQFGYLNKNAFTVTIPLSSNNVVSPSNLDGSQPISFAPGTQHKVFQITFFKHQSVTWSLKGFTATASNNSPHC